VGADLVMGALKQNASPLTRLNLRMLISRAEGWNSDVSRA
jgi:hypothetical protein